MRSLFSFSICLGCLISLRHFSSLSLCLFFSLFFYRHEFHGFACALLSRLVCASTCTQILHHLPTPTLIFPTSLLPSRWCHCIIICMRVSLEGLFPVASAPAFTRSGKSPGSPDVGNMQPMQPASPEYKTSGLYIPGARRLGNQTIQETIELSRGGGMWLGGLK